MRLWLMVGCPGSGKTHFARTVMMEGEGIKYISRDEIRYSMVRSNESYFSKETAVFKEFVRQINEALDSENEYVSDVIADATHLNWSSRSKLLRALGILTEERFYVDVIPVVMTTSFEESLRRNNTRNGRACVPEKDLRRMYNSQTHPRLDPFKYAAIMEV